MADAEINQATSAFSRPLGPISDSARPTASQKTRKTIKQSNAPSKLVDESFRPASEAAAFNPQPGSDPLSSFHPVIQTWFRRRFAAPTDAQAAGWPLIQTGRDVLIAAPTGSGKTLAAFLWALDALHREHEAGTAGGTRILYISPLKALGADVERNLRAPLTGITRLSGNNTGEPNISVGVRSGDTPARERRQLISNPPDILITTPESLYLMLTSAARNTLAGVTTVIVDEIHNLAATKRGAHLAVSLERLDALLEKPAQRIGLSATVENPEAVARFLGGIQPVTIMSRPVAKEWDLRLSVPVPDMAALGGANDYGQGLYAPSEMQGGGGSASTSSPVSAAQPISSEIGRASCRERV